MSGLNFESAVNQFLRDFHKHVDDFSRSDKADKLG